jgi:peptidoglycan/LPS O-acetylase OafA/YrhL
MVDLFFVISGFVIEKAYGKNINNYSDLLKFQFLRFGRLYPIHILCLIIFISYTATPFFETNWTALLQNLFLVQAIGPTGNAYSFNAQAWSISVEFYVYVLFGVITIHFKNTLNLYIFLAISSLIILILPSISSILENTLSGWSELLRCIAGFAIGAIIAKIDVCKRKGVNFLFTIAGMTSIIFILLSKDNEFFKVFIYFSSAMLVFFIASPNFELFKKFLCLKPLIFLGEISYTLYMCHWLVIYPFDNPELFDAHFKGRIEYLLNINFSNSPSLLYFYYPFKLVLFFSALFAFSKLAYELIEKPCRKWSRNKLGAKPLPQIINKI